MKVRYYDAQFTPPNLVTELDAMVKSGSLTAYEAAARFVTALRHMERDQQVYAKPAGPAVLAHFGKPDSSVFGGPAVCMYRHSHGHRLYLTFIPRPASPRGELRSLVVNPENEKTFAALDTAVIRHMAM